MFIIYYYLLFNHLIILSQLYDKVTIFINSKFNFKSRLFFFELLAIVLNTHPYCLPCIRPILYKHTEEETKIKVWISFSRYLFTSVHNVYHSLYESNLSNINYDHSQYCEQNFYWINRILMRIIGECFCEWGISLTLSYLHGYRQWGCFED